jgi:hypothetical protein
MKSLLIFTLFSASLAHAEGWESLPPLPEPNGGFICGTMKGGIVIGGGTNWVDGSKLWLDKVWFFDAASKQWSAKGKLPHPLGYAVCGEWRGNLVVAGGFDGTTASDEVWLLTPTFEWKLVGHLKVAVSLAAGGVCGDDLIVTGGTPDPTKLDALVSTTQRLNLVNGSVSLVSAPREVGTGTVASVAVESHLLLFGGARFDAVSAVANLDQAWTFDSSKTSWTELPAYPVTVRACDAVALNGQHFYIAGGYTDDFTAKAWVFDSKTQSYTPSVPLPMPNCTKLIRCGDCVYALGGEPAKKVRSDKVWRIRLRDLQ